MPRISYVGTLLKEITYLMYIVDWFLDFLVGGDEMEIIDLNLLSKVNLNAMYSTCKQIDVKGRACSLQDFGKGVLPRDIPKKILAFQMDVPAPRSLKIAPK